MEAGKALSREERLAQWREERRKAKAKAAGKATGGAKRPAARRRRRALVSKEKSGGRGTVTVEEERAASGSRHEPTAAAAKRAGAISNVMRGPAVRLAVGSKEIKAARSMTTTTTKKKKQGGSKVDAVKKPADLTACSSENSPRFGNSRKRSLGGKPSARVMSKPKHKTPTTNRAPAKSNIFAPTASSTNKKRSSKRTTPVTRRPASNSLRRTKKNNAGAKSGKDLPTTSEAIAVASAVPLPTEPLQSVSTDGISDDDSMSPVADSATLLSPHADENVLGEQDKGKQKSRRRSVGGSKRRSKNTTKRRRRRQSICFDAQAMSDLSDVKSTPSPEIRTDLEIHGHVAPTAHAPLQASTVQTVLASPIVDFSNDEKPSALGATDNAVAAKHPQCPDATSAPLPPSVPAQPTATAPSNTNPSSATAANASVLGLARGSTGRLLWQACVHRAKYRSLTTQINSSQERVRELEARLLQAEACNKRIVEEAADVVYERNNLAQALRQAEAKIAAQNAKVDGEEVEDVESLLVKLKRAEKKIANLAFENEMTMQEMAQQAESFEEEIEQEAVARDMDVRAAEKKAEEAIKESEQLKAQLQQVQLKFTGALKQALARNAELSSQLETAKEAASSPVEED